MDIISLSDLTAPSEGPFESGVSFEEIEEIALYREALQNKLGDELGNGNRLNHQAQQMLGELERRHTAACQLDTDHKCGSRAKIRGAIQIV